MTLTLVLVLSLTIGFIIGLYSHVWAWGDDYPSHCPACYVKIDDCMVEEQVNVL